MSDVDDLIGQLVGGTVTSPETSKEPVANTSTTTQYTHNNNVENESYQLPIRVGRDNKPISQNNKPWVVGTFLPKQYINPMHTHGHDAVDLKAPRGTPIYPISSGIVIEVAPNQKGGNTCKTSHENGNVVCYYAHMDKINVSAGQKVSPNTVLGTVGDSGTAKGNPHLHFSTRVDGNLVDPFSVIGKKVGTLSQKAKIAAILNMLDKYAAPMGVPVQINRNKMVTDDEPIFLSNKPNVVAQIIDQFLSKHSNIPDIATQITGREITGILGPVSGIKLGQALKTLKEKLSEQPNMTKEQILIFTKIAISK